MLFVVARLGYVIVYGELVIHPVRRNSHIGNVVGRSG